MNTTLIIVIVAIVGFFAFTVAFGALLLPVMFRRLTEGKLIAIMHGHRTIKSALLKEDTEHNCLWVGAEGSVDREKYIIDDSKIILVNYPAGLPVWMTVKVRALEYVRNNPNPWDPEVTHVSKITAKTFRLITDENMLKNAWKDVREGLGLQNKGSKAVSYVIYGVAAAIGIGVINIAMTLMTQSKVQQIITITSNMTQGK